MQNDSAIPVARQEGNTLPLSISVVMSIPRLIWSDNIFGVMRACAAYGLPLRKYSGAFWGQCLERTFEAVLADDPRPDAILTVDYDTLFNPADVAALAQLMHEHPEADAIAPIQCHRSKPFPLMTIKDSDGKPQEHVPLSLFEAPLTKLATAHFGLTLIRTSKVASLPRPWFVGTPGADGRWGEDRTDDDVHFWRQWEAAGNTLYLANRVAVGHIEAVALWPNNRLGTGFQPVSDFYQTGRPEWVWQ